MQHCNLRVNSYVDSSSWCSLTLSECYFLGSQSSADSIGSVSFIGSLLSVDSRIELINRCVGLGNLLLDGRSASFLPTLNVGSRRLGLNQCCSLLCSQVLHLDR